MKDSGFEAWSDEVKTGYTTEYKAWLHIQVIRYNAAHRV